MKTNRITLLLAAIFIASLSLMSQPGPGRIARGDNMKGKEMMMEKLNLTEEQKSQIEEMRKAHMDKTQQLRAQLKIKEAELDAAMLEENQKSANGLVADINDLRSNLFANQISHQLTIKGLLDEDQKRIFDRMIIARDSFDGHGKGHRGRMHGHHGGQGQRLHQHGQGN